MAFQIITPKEANFPISLFTLSPGTEKDNDLAFFPLDCCTYSVYLIAPLPTLEADTDGEVEPREARPI